MRSIWTLRELDEGQNKYPGVLFGSEITPPKEHLVTIREFHEVLGIVSLIASYCTSVVSADIHNCPDLTVVGPEIWIRRVRNIDLDGISLVEALHRSVIFNFVSSIREQFTYNLERLQFIQFFPDPLALL